MFLYIKCLRIKNTYHRLAAYMVQFYYIAIDGLPCCHWWHMSKKGTHTLHSNTPLHTHSPCPETLGHREHQGMVGLLQMDNLSKSLFTLVTPIITCFTFWNSTVLPLLVWISSEAPQASSIIVRVPAVVVVTNTMELVVLGGIVCPYLTRESTVCHRGCPSVAYILVLTTNT